MWGIITNVSENKQEIGYQQATFKAQPLNGTMPKANALSAENWARGDLRAAFKAPLSAPKLTIAENQPRAAGPDAAPANKSAPSTQANAPTPANGSPADNAAAQNAPSQQQDQDKPVTMNATAAHATAKAANPLVIPPQFAPVMAAGLLSAQHNEKAEGPQDDFQNVFSIKSSNYHLRVRHARLEESYEHAGASTQKDETFMFEQALVEQHKSFMRSIEYSAAMNTVDREIRKLEGERKQAYARKQQVEENIADTNENIETATAEVGALEQSKAELVELKEKKDEYDADVSLEKEMHQKSDEITQESFISAENTLKLVGKDVFITAEENGKTVNYKIDEQGQKTKVDDMPYIDPINDKVYLKRNEDGTQELVNHFNAPLETEQKEIVEKALAASNTKADSVVSTHFGETARAQKILNGVAHEDIDQQTQKTNKSEKTLHENAEKIGFPIASLPMLDDSIDQLGADIAGKKAQIEEWRASNTKSAEELKIIEQNIARCEDQLKASAKFKEDLKNGTFKDTAEMEKAMPGFLKHSYRENLAQAQDKTQQANASPEASSRINGSAAEPSVKASTTLARPFAAAASGTAAKDVDAPAPAEPAPEDNMEYAAIRQQPKSMALGMG